MASPVFTLKNLAGTTTLFEVDSDGNVTAAGTISTTGTDDFGTLGIKADVIAESTAAAGVTIDGLRIKDGAITPAAGAAAFIDVSGNATGESDLILGANLADAFTFRTAALTYLKIRSSTATPGIDETFALSGTGDAHNIVATMSHATQVAEGLDVTVQQITNARTAGSISAIRANVVSLAGSTAGTDHYAFEAAVTAGEGVADHFAFKQGAGFDQTFDTTLCATTEVGWLVNPNVADAWHLKDATRTFAVLRSTTATPGIDETFTLTATGDAHNIQALVNSATGVVQALDVGITTTTTNHTAGLLSAVRASTTSLAGDTGGDFACIELASTDGGGATPFHSGLYSASALDALIKVSADGMGGVVIGSTMTISPETTAESGYFRFNVGATVYQVPIYAA